MRNTMPMPTRRDNERGIALVLSLLLTLMMSVLAASLMFLSQTETYASMNYRMMSQARFGAESGVHKAVNFLLYHYDAPGGPGDPGGLLTDYDRTKSPVVDVVTGDAIVLSANSGILSNYPNEAVRVAFEQAAQGTLAAGNGTVQFAASATLMSMQQVGNQTYTSWEITSDGTIGGARPATVTVTSVLEKQLTPGPGTLYAAFATANTCAMNFFNTTFNSYDSTEELGDDGRPITTDSGANVGTNGTMHAWGNSHVHGSLSTPKVGVGGDCITENSNATTSSGDASLRGGIVQASHPEMPAPPSPQPAPEFSQNITVSGVAPCQDDVTGCTTNPDGSKTFEPGNYGNITLTNSTNLHLVAGTYHVNSLNGLSGSRIIIDSSPVIINIVDEVAPTPLILRSSIGTSPVTYNPKQLLINYAGAGTIEIHEVPSRPFVGQIYAPNARLTVNTEIYGSVIGKTLSMMMLTATAGAGLHFDRSLSATTTFQVGPDMLTSFSWKKF